MIISEIRDHVSFPCLMEHQKTGVIIAMRGWESGVVIRAPKALEDQLFRTINERVYATCDLHVFNGTLTLRNEIQDSQGEADD